MEKNNSNIKKTSGSALIAMALGVGVFATIGGLGLMAINPSRHLALARNEQRMSNVNALITAIVLMNSENGGMSEKGCAAGPIPAVETNIGSGMGDYNIAPCLVTKYMSSFPFDPAEHGAHFTDNADYNTGYMISKNEKTGRITIRSPFAELKARISTTK